jgi:hypothetical protein
VSNKAVVFAAIVVGFVLVPPLARANAPLVNGFLFLILFGSLLNRRDVWLPYIGQVASTTSAGTSAKAPGVLPARTP